MMSVWSKKALALLLPTPLATADAAGEAGREARVVATLRAAGWSELPSPGSPAWVEVADELATCRRDAARSHAARSAASPRGELRHPLSLEGVSAAPTMERQAAAWEELLGAVEGLRADADEGRRYAAIWRVAMRSRLYKETPGDAVLRDHAIGSHRSVAAALVGARHAGGEAALLQIHVGPVQSFIAAARRTSDLWIGSYLVAYLAFAAVEALALRAGPDAIVYPDLAELALADRLLFAAEEAIEPEVLLRAALPNRFMAVVPRADAEACAQAVVRAVHARWREIGAAVWRWLARAGQVDAAGLQRDFEAQLGDHLEIDATALRWPADPEAAGQVLARVGGTWTGRTGEGVGESYGAFFGALRRLMTAQRTLVGAAGGRGDERRKCTQCGRREQLGPREGDGRRWWRDLLNALGKTAGQEESLDLRAGEALCAVCATKRWAPRAYFGGKGGPFGLDWADREGDRARLRFASVATIASAPLRQRLRTAGRESEALQAALVQWDAALRALQGLLRFTPPGNQVPGVEAVGRRGNFLDHDGTWLYTSSYASDTVLRDHDGCDAKMVGEERFEAALARAKGCFAAVCAALREKDGGAPKASGYFAVLCCDVDEMGRWLEGAHEAGPRWGDFNEEPREGLRAVHPALAREVSRRQGHLVASVLSEVVERHLGRMIYSGGDDVLALLPLATVWRCVAALQQEFQAKTALGARVRVSSGVAVAHWRGPLALALGRARAAEARAKAEAKDRRDAGARESVVAVEVLVRSGASLQHVFAAPQIDALEQLLALGEVFVGTNLVEPLRRELAVLRGNGDAAACRVRALFSRACRGLKEDQREALRGPLRAFVGVDLAPEGNPAPVEPERLVEALALLRFLARELST